MPTGEARAGGQARAEVGSSQAVAQAQAEAGSSQMATPPMDDDRRRIIRPCEPMTYDQDHTRAGARALWGKRGM
jgi:hypothetical protein